MVPDAVTPVFLSTDMLPEPERFDAWRESFALRLVRVDATTPDRASFRAAIGMLPLQRQSLVICDVGAVSLKRTKELLRDGNDDVSLVICTAGTAEARFDGTSCVLGPGDAVLIPSDRAGEVIADLRTTTLTLRLSRALLRDVIGVPDPPCLRRIPHSDLRLSLLFSYVRQVAAMNGPVPASTLRLADRHLVELAAHLLDPTSELARAAPFGGIKAARLKAVLAGIDRHLVDPRLSAQWLGARLGLSERYVHHLLAEAGLSFAQLVRRKRLEQARAMLEDGAGPPRRIVDIAYAVGFSDLSNFNHAFRQQFGRTPSDVRRGS